jgi:hypothetical protein
MVELHVFLAGASGRARNPIICDGLVVHHQSMRARLCHRRPFRICTSQGMTLVALLTLSLLTRSWRGFLPKLFSPRPQSQTRNKLFFRPPNSKLCFYLQRKKLPTRARNSVCWDANTRVCISIRSAKVILQEANMHGVRGKDARPKSH